MPRLSEKARTARENGKKSQGPVTAEGKLRSKYNAVDYALTADGKFVLDGEEKDQLHTYLGNLVAAGPPRDGLEAEKVEDVAFAKLRVWRCKRAEAARLKHAAAHAREEKELALMEEARLIGERLAFDPADEAQVARGIPLDDRLARREADGPELLSRRLEASAHGAEWKLAQWKTLELILHATGRWEIVDVRLAVRLLGLRPENTCYDANVGELIAASYLATGANHPLPDYFQQVWYRGGGRPVRPDMAATYRALFAAEATAADGRDFLVKLVEGQVARLERLLATRLDAEREATLDLVADDARVDPSRRGDLNRRYEAAARRELRLLEAELKELRARVFEEEAEPAPGPDPAEPAGDSFGTVDESELASVMEFASPNTRVGFVSREPEDGAPGLPPVDRKWLIIEQISYRTDALLARQARLYGDLLAELTE